MVIAAIIGANARDGLYEKASGGGLRYAGPPQQRVMVLLFGVSFLWAAFSLPPGALGGVFKLFFLALALGTIYASGPRELLVDRDRRTYQVRSGWPMAPQERRGRWTTWGACGSLSSPAATAARIS